MYSETTATMRLLVITLSNIGDAVMTTPVIVALRQQYPDAIIDIVTDARACELFEHMPGKGTVFLKDKQAGWGGTARLVQPSLGSDPALVVTGAAANGFVQITMATVTNQSGLVFRLRNASNYWAIVAAPPFATWNVIRVVDGETETIGNVGLAPVIDRTVIALWLGHESVETTQIYLHADMRLKEQALSRITPVDVKPGRYRPDDDLLAFLEGL